MAGIVSIALGGALGALSRYGVALFIADRWHTTFPWPTFVINVTGCFILALFTPLAAQWTGLTWLRLGFATGFVGAYTTFSTYMVESLTLSRQDHPAVAGVYALGSVMVGFTAAWLGNLLAQSLRGPGA